MAHHIKIKSKPHQNKDGSLSASKRDHVVTDRHRGKKRVVGVATSRKAAEQMVADEHARLNENRGK